MKQKNYNIPTVVYFVVTALLIAYFFPREGKFRYQFYEGKPWRYGLLTAPSDFPIYKTDDEVKAEKDSVLRKFEPYYRMNPDIQKQDIPGVVYTNPEIAGVGKTEEELQAEGISYTVKKIPMAFSGRFVAENEMGNGVCKLILSEDETLIGAHMLGNPASELIVIAGIAIEKGMKSDELKSFVFPHPTVGEIIKEALY